MKEIEFLGDSLKAICEFGPKARRDAGFQLRQVQKGDLPEDWKPMSTIGPGVNEIHLWDEAGTYRVIYTAKFEDVVYVLHAFQKKTQATLQRDIALARKRLTALLARKKG